MTAGSSAQETPREELGRRLRALLAAAGLNTVTAVGRLQAIGVQATQSRVYRTVHARAAPTVEFVDALCRACGANEEERRALAALAAQVREGNRRLVLGRDHRAAQVRIGRYTREASLVRGFGPTALPGELQAERYVEQVMGGPGKPGVQERMRNQTLLDDTSREWRFVLTEGALGFPALLPAASMADQLDHLADSDERRPNLSIGIVPWGRPCPHMALHTWTLYDDRVLVTGGATFAMDITDPDDLAAYVKLTDALERVAVWGEEARGLIRDCADRYRAL